VIAGAVGWEGDPGALWASLTRSGIVDAFGAITGWASTGGRRGARLSAMAQSGPGSSPAQCAGASRATPTSNECAAAACGRCSLRLRRPITRQIKWRFPQVSARCRCGVDRLADNAASLNVVLTEGPGTDSMLPPLQIEIPYRACALDLHAPVAGEPWSMLLDSGPSRAHPMARFDIVVAGPATTLVTRGRITEIEHHHADGRPPSPERVSMRWTFI
jgi:hypothetical protein